MRIPNISGIDINGISLHKYETESDFQYHCRTPDSDIVDLVLSSPQLHSRAEEYLHFRVSGQEQHHDVIRAFSGQKENVSRSFLIAKYNFNPGKKIVLVLSHVFCDAPHAFPGLLFHNFQDWLIATCKVLSKNPDVNFLIKDHPSSDLYNETGLLEKVLAEHGFQGHFLSSDVNTSSLFHSVDVIVTCGGTAGMEFPCFGVPVLVAAKPSYAQYPFIKSPNTQSEYLMALEKIGNWQKLSESEMSFAKCILYIIQNVIKIDKSVIGLGSQPYFINCNFNMELFLEEMIKDCQDGSKYIELLEMLDEFLSGNHKNMIDYQKISIDLKTPSEARFIHALHNR